MQRFTNHERPSFPAPSALVDVLRVLAPQAESLEASTKIAACLAGIDPGHVGLLSASLAQLGLMPAIVVDGVGVSQLGLLAPSVLIVDLDHLEADPYETLRMVRFVLPNCLIAVYTGELTRERAVGCHMAGANCLLSKASDEGALSDGLQQARESGCFTDPSFLKSSRASRNIPRKNLGDFMVSSARIVGSSRSLLGRILQSFAITGSLLLSTSVLATAAAQAPTIYVDGARTSVPALQRANRVFVPARSVFEKIGAAVDYTGSGNVVARKGRTTLANLTLGSRTAQVRGATLRLDAAPFRAGNRVYVPLRLISEAAGATVSYGRNPRTVRISGVQLAATAPVVATAPVAAPVVHRGIPWWVWLILALIVLAILFALMRRGKAEPTITTTRSAQGEPTIPSRSGTTNSGTTSPTISTRSDR